MLVTAAARSDRRDAPGDRPAPIRPPIAVIVSRFPVVTETFILRELDELERQGQPVILIPLLQADVNAVRPAIHREAERWIARALYTPFMSMAIAGANLEMARRRPRQYFTILGHLIAGSAHRWNVLVRTLALFPKSVFLARWLERQGVRHVHAHFATYPASVALTIRRLTGISFSVTAHAHDVFVPWRRVMLVPKMREAAFVRVIAGFVRDYLRRECPGRDANLHVVHVGVPTEDAASPIETARRFAPPPIVLCVAALKPYKGVRVLLDACRELMSRRVSFSCLVAGDGPLGRELTRLRDEWGLGHHVALLGAKRQDEIAALVRDAALVVMPSVEAADGQMDGIPVALMEAMASGKPVVASRLSGIPELVHQGVNGLLVTPGDAGELGDAIKAVLTHQGLARRLGARGRQTIDREFRLDATVTSLIDLIDPHNVAPLDGDRAGVLALARRIAADTPVGIRAVHNRPDSTVAELLIGGAHPRDVILKIHTIRDGGPSTSLRAGVQTARRHARVEYAALRMFQNLETSEPRNLGTPEPRDLFEAEAALTMSRCEGRSLVDRIRASRLSRRSGAFDLDRVLRDTGRWLRLMQAATAGMFESSSPLDAAVARATDGLAVRGGSLASHRDGRGAPPARRDEREYREYLNEKQRSRRGCIARRMQPDFHHGLLATCVRRGAMTAAEARRVQLRITALRSRCLPSSDRVVAQHGDFWPGNVFVSPDRLQVIDFEGFRSGGPFDDVAYFVVHLRLFFAYPGFARRGERVTRAFLAGYLADRPLDEAALDLCRTTAALQVLARPARDATQERARRPFWQRRVLRKECGL